jgi:protein transport protein SEC61 subunit alpha
MSGLRFIDLVQPVRNYLPEVESPLKKQAFKEKLLWTAITLFIYLICC